MNINLKKIRKKLGLSQQEFANKLDVTQTLISKIESGRSKPTLSMLEEISEIFNLDLIQIMFGDSEIYQSFLTIHDNANDPDIPYNPKGIKEKQIVNSEDKWMNIIEKLVSIIEEKNTQVSKLINTIDRLTGNNK